MAHHTSKTFIRPCPPDFVDVYLQIGWDGIEDHYRAHKHTIKRWVQECGGDELKARRRECVKASRRARAYIRGVVPTPVIDGIEVDDDIQAAAAQHLRHPRSGGWVVSMTGQGDWRVGTMRKSPAELLEMATRKGFDVSAVTLSRRKG